MIDSTRRKSQLHASIRGPKAPKPPRRRHRRSGATAIAATAAIAVLAVVVAILSYESATRDPGVKQSDLASLEVRLDVLGGQLDAMKKQVKASRQDASRALATARNAKAPKKGAPNLSVCLYQVQREIDDLQAYLVYRTTPAATRVTGACLRLLVPRFAG